MASEVGLTWDELPDSSLRSEVMVTAERYGYGPGGAADTALLGACRA